MINITSKTRKLLELLGYTSLYPPQVKALESSIEHGVSLIVSAPTASGKTLIGLIAIINKLDPGTGKAFYTVPLRSIALEKYREFKVLESLGYSLGVSVGDYSEGDIKGDIVVTTYEKLDSLLRNDIKLIDTIKVLVVDELHYINDSERGPVLESLLAKVLSSTSNLQIIGLSATIPNAQELSQWLGARLIVDGWRPIPLYEGVYWKGKIYYSDGKIRDVREETGYADLDLILDSTREGGQCLVFSQSRKRVVQLALRSYKFSSKLNFDASIAREAAASIASSEGPRVLREELSRLVAGGVAYHHAGLSSELRKIIEDAFRQGGLSVIYATPTLAAGVNLPARRVIVDEYYRFEDGMWKPISVTEYKQLAGRAGRPGLDPYGEAIVIANSKDDVDDILDEYIRGEVERVESKLRGVRGLRHMILGIIASGFAKSLEDIVSVLKKTLYAFQNSLVDIRLKASIAINDLRNWGLIEGSREFNATIIGYEVSRNYLDPETVPIVKANLDKLKLQNDLDLLLLTSLMPDMTTLPVPKREEEILLDKILDSAPHIVDIIDWLDARTVRAVKVALILYDWINEVSDDDITRIYNIGPGDIAVLVDNATWITSGLSRIIGLLGAPREVEENLKLIEKRLRYGIRRELLPLVVIPKIGRVRARRLYNAGYKTIQDLIFADPRDLLKIPGIGPQTVKAIMDFLGREYHPDYREDRGLEGFID
ncbi:MAG: DEAD/DEAH box helicase [Acidilobaceae archaeon]